ncbi:class I SAM-dependent methyltransferase [Sphingomonas sp. GC_Shp_3]|uniref:class I SAM-dependent methyltransferase n=1 Tax=Sphingomonas sp. GC_Shp_3 TaxID=2937383 RepID=UPI002269D775|nr:class I SAM-dependent methyltransferase [Sphingomonas sp. GC_Shp_3]
MLRSEVNQEILSILPGKSYLEVGVNRGKTFFEVIADQKVAVDPNFLFDFEAERANPQSKNCEFYQLKSDVFFSEFGHNRRFDLIFLDGLHTYEQTLRDLMNSITCINTNGVIVIDDMIPSTYISSISELSQSQRLSAALGNTDSSWMGDVFRLAFFIESFLPAFSFATVGENHGQMVLWRQTRKNIPERTLESTCRMDFGDSVLQRSVFNVLPCAEIISRITSART